MPDEIWMAFETMIGTAATLSRSDDNFCHVLFDLTGPGRIPLETDMCVTTQATDCWMQLFSCTWGNTAESRYRSEDGIEVTFMDSIRAICERGANLTE